jgi:GNAT superfamily N-acetyltransferase
VTAADSVTIRRGTLDDARACHDVLWQSVTDLARRHATPLEGTAAEWWSSGERLHRFLAEHAAEWWVAEERESAAVIGYARSIARGGLTELTEFFVIPGHQSAGLGRALLERAFPDGRGDVRSIIATTDTRAQSRYVRAGTTAQFPFFSLVGAPRQVSTSGDLTAHVIDIDSASDRGLVRDIERAVLEYPRGDAEIRWLLENRSGFLYRHDGAAVGFAFLGQHGVGPIAVLEPEQLPDVLLDVEARASAAGITHLDFQVPAPNQVATRHLLSRGFRFDPWINLLMSSRPFGRFDRFIGFGPPMFL